MRSIFRAFLNCTSCVGFEPVKRTTYVVIECNGKLFLAPTVDLWTTNASQANSILFFVVVITPHDSRYARG